VPTTTPNDFSDLEALLTEATTAQRDAARVKEARERAKRGGLAPQERAEDEARIRAWEARNEWQDAANVACFERYRCACGRQQTIFRQLMRRQTHRHLKQGATRWIEATESLASLPSEIVVKRWNTPMCTTCAPAAGFDFTHHMAKEIPE
jgi:hypothetical protein